MKRHCDSMERSHNAFIYIEILQIFGRSGTFELVVVCFDATIEQFPLPIGFSAKDRWEYGYALDMMRSKAGSCYHFAAAYAFLVKRATGYPVRIGYGTSDAFRKGNFQPHAWCEIKIGNTWYTFDTNVAWAKKNNPDGVRLSSGKCYMQKRSSMVGKIYKNAKYVNVEL